MIHGLRNKGLSDAELEIMKVVWTNEPPVTTTNLMVIRMAGTFIFSAFVADLVLRATGAI